MVRSVRIAACLVTVGDAWKVPQLTSACPEERELLVRYTKGLDKRGDDAFRLTVLGTTPVSAVKCDSKPLNMTPPRRIELNECLTTSQEVLANWSSFWYSSAVLNVTEKSHVNVATSCGPTSFDVRNPGRGQGHVSIVFGDPYYGVDNIGGEPVYVNISRQLPAMVNNLAEFDNVYSLGVLGDFWYEMAPFDNMDFNRRLTLKSKSLMTYSVLGNHDYWQAGRALNDGVHREKPENGRLGTMTDFVHGYGWTQFWGQDTIGIWNNELDGLEPYAGKAFMQHQSKKYNDVTYTQDKPVHGLPQEFSSSYFVHGNRGYILSSGVWSFQAQKAWLMEACAAMEREDVTSIWLVSHWSEDIHNPHDEGFVGHACGADLSARRLFDHISVGDLGTDSPCYRAYSAGQLKFLQGHDHWNDCVMDQQIIVDGVETAVCAGWQVAGAGKGTGTLDGTLPPDQTTIECPMCDDTEFTIAAVDTRDDMLRLGFLQMVSDMKDRSQDWTDCFQKMGDDFSFDFIVEHCQSQESLPLVHVWSQPLKKLFGTEEYRIV